MGKKTTIKESKADVKALELVRKLEQSAIYKDLAKVKQHVDDALRWIGQIDSCENLSSAAFIAGRAFGPIDKANDLIYEMLEQIYDSNDFDHWDSLEDNF